MFPIRPPHQVPERVTRQIPEFIAAATSAIMAGRARNAAAGSKGGLRFGVVVVVALMTLTACTTVEDGWDSMFGSSDSEEGSSQPEGLNGVSQPPSYSNGTGGARKAPSEQYALNDAPVDPAPASTPAPAKVETASAPAPVEKTAPKPEPVPPPPSMPVQDRAPTPVTPSAPIEPPATSYPVPTYVPPSPYDGETTTVISGNGKVSVQTYDPAPYNASGGRAISNTGGLGMGLSMTGLGPYPLEAYSNAGTSVSTQVATIQFSDGATGLSAQDRAILRQVVALQRQHGGVLRVIGHASARTDDMSWNRHDQANLKVSQQRAKTVMRALLEAGAPSSSLYVGAMADNEPLYQESMPSGEAGNRRTEIYLDY